MENENIMAKVYEATECKIKEIMEEGLTQDTVDYLGKVVDIHKDLSNEIYWEIKEDNMRYRGSYRESGNYGNNYGNFDNYRGSYGRRGYDTKYRGEEMLDEMAQHYGNYHDSNSYGAKEDSAYKMTEAFKEFGFNIAQELEPKEKMMFKDAMQEIMQELDR